jgi:glycosyltransferase involved in cell wall biosynthesis
VTANRPPFTEFLTSETAFLVDPESPMEIAQAAIAALQPKIKEEMGNRGQALCAEYSWENSATMHVEHYVQFLQG